VFHEAQHSITNRSSSFEENASKDRNTPSDRPCFLAFKEGWLGEVEAAESQLAGSNDKGSSRHTGYNNNIVLQCRGSPVERMH